MENEDFHAMKRFNLDMGKNTMDEIVLARVLARMDGMLEDGVAKIFGEKLLQRILKRVSNNDNKRDGNKEPPNSEPPLTENQVRQIQTILDKVQYLQLEFEYGKALVSTQGTMTIKTTNGIIEVATTAGQYDNFIRGLGFIGNVALVINAGVDIAEYSDGRISGARLGYRLTGSAMSFATPIVYGAIVGSEAPVIGTVTGIVVGATFSAGEYLLDPTIKRPDELLRKEDIA